MHVSGSCLPVVVDAESDVDGDDLPEALLPDGSPFQNLSVLATGPSFKTTDSSKATDSSSANDSSKATDSSKTTDSSNSQEKVLPQSGVSSVSEKSTSGNKSTSVPGISLTGRMVVDLSSLQNDLDHGKILMIGTTHLLLVV